MNDFTVWYGLKLHCDEETMGEVTEHLAMNGYTFDTNCEDIIFIYEEEVDYLITILNDREIEFEAV